MSQPRQKDPSDPLYDANDKWNEYKVELHCNEEHSDDEWDRTTTEEEFNDADTVQFSFERAKLVREEALSLMQKSQYFQAKEIVIEAYESFNQLRKQSSEEEILYLDLLGDVFLKLGPVDKAYWNYKKCLDLHLEIYDQDHPSLCICYNKLGYSHDSKGEYDKALECFQKSLEIGLSNYGPEHPEVGTSYNNIGNTYRELGEYDKAIQYLNKSLAIYLEVLSFAHPFIGTTYNNLGNAYKHKADYDRAFEYFDKSLKIRLQSLGPEHPDVGMTYKNVANTYKSKGEYDKAIEYYDKSLKISEKAFGSSHPFVKDLEAEIVSIKLNSL